MSECRRQCEDQSRHVGLGCRLWLHSKWGHDSDLHEVGVADDNGDNEDDAAKADAAWLLVVDRLLADVRDVRGAPALACQYKRHGGREGGEGRAEAHLSQGGRNDGGQ